MHVSSNDLTNLKAAKLPTVREYRSKVAQLIERYRPIGVRTWGAMNEANHASQPTWNNPRRAAEYFLALRSMCKRCTILALDVLDQRGVDRYIKRFYAALGRRRSLAKFVGIHNYSDTNRRRDSGTRLIIDTVKGQNPAHSSGSPRPAAWRSSASRSRATRRTPDVPSDGRPRRSTSCSR